MRTQIPGSQVRDATIDSDDIEDLAITESKLSVTGVGAGPYTKVIVTTKGRVVAGENPNSLTGLGLIVNLDDLQDVVLTTPLATNVLKFDGVNWVNAPVTDVDGSLKLYSENPQGAAEATALGFNSVAIGSGAEAGASNSIAMGDQALTRIEGSMVFANGRFGSQGDAQTGRYLMRTHTLNTTPTELFLDGTGGMDRLLVSDDSTWTFVATVIGHQQDGNGHAGFRVKGVVYKVGAVNTYILGAVTKETIAAHAGWDVTVTADSTHSALKIMAIGEAGKIIRWLAIIETVEVTN